MLIARVRVTAMLRVRLRARVWLAAQRPAGGSAVPCSSRGRVRARGRLIARVGLGL
jgi:hypothetical protein